MSIILKHIKQGGLSGLLSLAGAVVLFCMMLLTSADVAFRYLFNSPILGSLEIIEFMVVLVVFFFVPISEREGAHVKVDLVVSTLPEGMRRGAKVFTLALSLAIMAMITWMTGLQAMETAEIGEYSSILHIPKSPFVWMVGLGCLAMCIELARQLIATLRGGDA